MLTARFHSKDKETEPYASAAGPVEYAAMAPRTNLLVVMLERVVLVFQL
jgi:hypothetical protein